jgi:hypothetical protein
MRENSENTLEALLQSLQELIAIVPLGFIYSKQDA